MEKKSVVPQMTKKVAIVQASGGSVIFDSSSEIAELAAEYGRVFPIDWSSFRYMISIDQRYELADVVAYLESLND